MVLLLALIVPTVAEAARRSVLTLLPYPPGRPISQLVLDGIQSTIRKAEPAVAISTDYIVQRNSVSAEVYATQLQWLRAKYRGVHFDVILVLGPQPFATLMELRKELWPGVPVVFCGVTNDVYRSIVPARNVTGTLLHTDLARNLRVYRRLFPDMERIALIGGASAVDRGFNNFARQIIHEFDPGIEIIDLTGRTLSELKTLVAKLPPKTVALQYSYFYDPSGQPMFLRELVSVLSPLSSVPLVETDDFTMGFGNLGGMLTHFSQIGDEAARIALRVLHGEKASSIPVVPFHPASLQFDWRELQRWKVPESRLPPGSEVLFRPFSIWEHYWWAIALVFVGVVFESVLVAVLLYQRQRARETEAARLRAELDAAAARDEISHLNRVAALGELAASLAHELNQPLLGILSNTEAAQRFLSRPEPDLVEVGAALEDIRDDDARASEIILRMRQMLKRQSIATEPVDIAAALKEALSLLRSNAILARIALELESPPEPGVVMAMADPVQLRQVIINLVLNAIEAIQGPGRVLIRVGPGIREGEVDILVSDSGPGVPKELESRVFQSFFSTKNEGLGMGLSITASILRSHGGRITLEKGAVPDLSGATFRVSLPSARLTRSAVSGSGQ